ncbi:MAG: hypothetical protein ABL996_26490 [Micropepsaceae bacterium]
MGYWRKIAAAAWRDTMALVRFDTIPRSLSTLTPPTLTAALTYYFTQGVAWSAVAFAISTAGISGCYFLYLMFAIPARLAGANEAEIKRLSPVPSSAIKRDVGLTEAIHYATTGEWKGGPVPLEDFEPELASQALVKLRQFAFENEVQVWGLFNHEEHVYTPVPNDFWAANQVEWFSFLKGEPHTDTIAYGAPANVYEKLMTCRAQIERAYIGFAPDKLVPPNIASRAGSHGVRS